MLSALILTPALHLPAVSPSVQRPAAVSRATVQMSNLDRRYVVAGAAALPAAIFAASPAAERKELVRMLALRTHPDKGGDPDVFRLLQSRKADFLQGRAS